MANTIVLGMQWGDEGKGKIVDLICPAFDAVVRYQGGHNAGHTVKFADRHFALHLLPSGILHSEMRCVLGNGMVIYPDALLKELRSIEEAGIDVTGRLFVAQRAQVILPLHSAVDQAREAARGDRKIGTTARGIGPSYEAKVARFGLRCGDLRAADLVDRLELQRRHFGPVLEGAGVPIPEVAELIEICHRWAEQLAPYLADTSQLLNRWIKDGKALLFEGAQGALLDVDHGTYPFVTSSNATAGGVAIGSGVAPTRLDGTLGVVKAYTTRVGEGPFPGELEETVGQHLRDRGNEYGTTTGRPRRCGWFDAVAARYATMINGVDILALTKLDVLDELEEIKVCTGYRFRGETLHDFPSEVAVLDEVEPIYRSFKGWQSSTVGLLEFADLPQTARDYIAFLEDQLEAPAALVSTGPRREETILTDQPELERLLSGRVARVLKERGVG
jgi:adenylosuccinate synthase